MLLTKANVTGVPSARSARAYMNPGWNNAAVVELQGDFSTQCLITGLADWSPFFLSAQLPPSLAGCPSHLHFLLHWLLSCVSSLSCCIHPSIRTQRVRETRQISRVTGLVGTSESRLMVPDTYFFWNQLGYLPRKQGHSQEDNELNFPGEVN